MTGEFSFNRDTFFEKNNSNKGKFLPQIVATFFYLWLLLFEESLLSKVEDLTHINCTEYDLAFSKINITLYSSFFKINDKTLRLFENSNAKKNLGTSNK
ncbi:hypothetical protein BpHYR1_008644 [Brachionus plicatilis]|uniref:Uncharacterized protein n=1 Tax=Brachionus plicatilis TaxID=10195 RepID=A0A3M7TAJ0_BRAPC|nr:hypothetical protein BpHYR1_008644 [Brachionus plicatilis]